MRDFSKKCILKALPSLRRIKDQRDELQQQVQRMAAEEAQLQQQVQRMAAEEAQLQQQVQRMAAEEAQLQQQVQRMAAEEVQYRDYSDTAGIILQYRQAYYEMHGHIAPGAALPTSRAWPEPDPGLSYKDKLTHLLPLSSGVGVEIGPLNIPTLSKAECRVLYLDHLDTEGLRKKYPTVSDIVPIDRPMVNNSLEDTLCSDSPLDFLLGSQVFEHVPNPIRWLREAAAVLRVGGLLALSLPDRRMTFDFLREETRPADIVSAYFEDATIPNVQCVYDNQSLAAYINMEWASSLSVYPEQIVAGRGAISPVKAEKNHLNLVQLAKAGEYLDSHCWVFTPVSFLLTMAQLAADGFLQFRCRQFYPTTPNFPDRGNSSFTIILEKVSSAESVEEIRRSFLAPLGDEGVEISRLSVVPSSEGVKVA